MKKKGLSLVKRLACAVLVLAGCNYPRYFQYTSVQGDYKCKVPFAWHVMKDGEGTDFTNATFLGPFEPDFYLGAPSFSVRWYGYFKPHRLPNGLLEMYSSVDDFIDQTLATVYGEERQMKQEVHEIKLGERRAKHFVVLSPAPVSQDRIWGVRVGEDKQRVNLRLHAYVLLPMESGFYALIYPATRDGFKKYEKQFNLLVNTFTPLKDGPGGKELASADRSAAR